MPIIHKVLLDTFLASLETLEVPLKGRMMTKGYMYILECSDGTFYTGSTRNIEKRFYEHQSSLGAIYKERLPVKLVYYEEYLRIDDAYLREKQVKKWSREKKLALINNDYGLLPELVKKVFRWK